MKLWKQKGRWFTQFGTGPTWVHDNRETAIAFLQSQGAGA